MKYSLPTRQLPERPVLSQLRHRAKDLLEEVRQNEEGALAEVRRFHNTADPNTFALHDAQLVLARSYGYDSWPKLKAYVTGLNLKCLLAAVQSNDIEQVQRILRVRPELVNMLEAWDYGVTALHYAVLARMPEMVRTLMQFGADPHLGISPHNEATGALTIATDRGYDEIAAIIREEERRREPGRPTADQVPPELRRALLSRDEDAAIHILEGHPALISFQVPDTRETLLHLASKMLLGNVVSWLLGHGADVNARANDGSSPLDMTGQSCDAAKKAEKLSSVAGVLQNHGAETSARSAVISGDETFLRGCKPEELIAPQDDRGWLLSLAVDHDRPGILQFLLDAGLDPDSRVTVVGGDEISHSWGMPLYQCVRASKHAMAQIRLERGADPNGQVYASGTPLSEAYGQRDERMIALLESYGGKCNPSMAGFYRRRDLAEKLLAEHGDAPLPDDGFGSGTVAEQLVSAAARGGDPDILRMAIERVDWPDGDPRWYGAVKGPLEFWNHWIGPWCHHEWDRSGYLACFRVILARIGPPNARLRFGETLLHAIVTMGDHVTADERAAFATAALDAGARLDLRDDLLKSTPLGWACRWGRIELVDLFLQRGAHAAELDAEPWATPLAWAEKKGHREIVRLLRE